MTLVLWLTMNEGFSCDSSITYSELFRVPWVNLGYIAGDRRQNLKPSIAQVPEQSEFTDNAYLVAQSILKVPNSPTWFDFECPGTKTTTLVVETCSGTWTKRIHPYRLPSSCRATLRWDSNRLHTPNLTTFFDEHDRCARCQETCWVWSCRDRLVCSPTGVADLAHAFRVRVNVNPRVNPRGLTLDP